MSDAHSSEGRATAVGTRRFAARFPQLPGHFRCPDHLQLSSIGLGMRNGDPDGADSLLYRSAVPQLLRGGVNVFNTALSDRMQTSERNLGIALERAFREGDATRDEVFVVSRAGFLTVDPDLVDSRASAHRHLVDSYIHTGLVDPEHVVSGVHCIDAAFLRDQIARSRRNLRLATIDCYCIEEPELCLAAVGTNEFRRRLCAAFEALERAVAEGSIGSYGLCTWDGFLRPHTDRAHLSVLDVFEWALEVGGPDHHLRVLQLPYNLAMAEALKLPSQLVPTGRTDAILEALRGTGTVVMASAPLVQGRARGRLPAIVHDSFPGLRSDAQRCLQFARSSPGITSAIVGMRDPGHVAENLQLAAHPPAAPETIEALFKWSAEA